MSIGIAVTVDAREVKAAKREIEFLNKALNETESFGDLAPGKDGLSETSELVRKISEDIRRMKGLVTKGEQQGGLLGEKQFKEAATLSKRLGQNMGEYVKEIGKARDELGKLLNEKKKLGQVSPADPIAWTAAQERMEALKSREHELRIRHERLTRLDPKARDLARRGGEYTTAISGYGTMPEAEGNNIAAAGAALGFLRKTAGYAAVLMGGASLLSVARDSWSSYHQQAERESGLLLRGVRFNRELSPWGYLQSEQADAALALRRTTGASDPETLLRVQKFSRLSSMDPIAAIGMAGTYYNTTGADPQKQRQALDALLFMGKQAKDGRSEQLLGLINQNLTIASRAQGGRALTTAQASTVMAQTAALYNAPGTMGFSSNMYQTMQNALMPGGDPGSEIMKWDIIGGFNKGPLTGSRVLELERRRNAGLNDPQNLRRALAAARRFSKTRDGQIFYMMRLLNAFGQQGGIDQATAIIDNGNRLLNAKMPGSGDIDGLIKQQTGLYQDTAAHDIGQRYMKDDLVGITSGESLDPLAEKSQDAKWKLKSLFSRNGVHAKKSKYDPLILEKARKYGVNPLLLKSIVQEESGYNRFAVSPKGAKGLAQLMPKTGAQYGLKTEDDFYNPEKNLDASAHYLADLQREFGGNVSSMVLGYHSGASNVRKGNIGPAGRSYHGKVMGDLMAYSRDDNWKDWSEPTTGQQSEGVGLLKRIAETLEGISTEIGRTNFAPGAAGSLRAPWQMQPLPVPDR